MRAPLALLTTAMLFAIATPASADTMVWGTLNELVPGTEWKVEACHPSEKGVTLRRQNPNGYGQIVVHLQIGDTVGDLGSQDGLKMKLVDLRNCSGYFWIH